MQDILDSRFARPGSAPIEGGKIGEFRNWTTPALIQSTFGYISIEIVKWNRFNSFSFLYLFVYQAEV